MLKTKKAFDLPFSWLFAIIAGAFIILIAIYVTIQFVRTSQQTQYSEAALEISNYLNPVVNGITSAYATKINFRKETRLYFGCAATSQASPYFGKQTISFSEESGLIKKWNEPGAEISRYNKYVFADNIEQGKTLYLFSKPFFTGFRVDDLVFMGFNKYCFVSAPIIIEEEVENLALGNINVSNQLSLCGKDTRKVCFGFSDLACNISVFANCNDQNCESEYDTGYVLKNGKSLYYFKSLIYAAIFSSPEIYSCNIARLGKKIAELAEVYKGKIEIVKMKNCNSVISSQLETISTMAKNLDSSSKLLNTYQEAKTMDEIVCDEECKIYEPEKC